MNTPKPLVEIRDLAFAFGERKIFSGVNLDLARGKVTAIIGPSGSGKTSLLRILGGQWRPNAGTVRFDGQDVHALGRRELFKLRERMGVMFQSPALLTDYNVFDNVAFPLREQTHLPEALIRNIVLMKLQAVGLRGARNLFPHELSGGMARRVMMARAIAADPDLAIYDEPFAGQDPITLGVLMRLIRTLNDALSLTSLVISHSVEEVLAIADEVFVLAEGKLLEHGSADEIRNSRSELVRQFQSGQADGPVRFHYPAPPLADDLRLRA